jgi:tRNA G18 (ribose-2'-O)-methylase SpoU
VIERVDPDDPRLTDYRHVGDAGWLRAAGLFVAEGRLVVSRVVENRRFTPVSILVTPAALAALETRLASAGAPVYVCEQSGLNAIAGFNFHRGCLALVRRPESIAIDALFSAHVLIGLQGVGNPDNVGGIFRSAAALGAGGVVIDDSTADPLYRKAVRTSMGATFRVPFVRIDDWREAVGPLKRAGYRIVGLTPGGEVDLHEVAPGGHALLLAGAEGAGLTDDALSRCDLRARIAMSPGVDSLNVVVAVSIALHRLGDSGGGPR